MKKKQQLLSIIGLFVATTIVLTAAFIKNYEKTDNFPEKELIVKDETQERIDDEIEDTEEADSEIVSTEEPMVSWEFVSADISYFDDALFIGDSRSVGIKEYGTLNNADFFVMEGMSVYNLPKQELEVDDLGAITLQQLLQQRSYSKIYIMLGLNEIGYNLDNVAKKFKETIDMLHEVQPEAIIYICSNLHVTKERSLQSDVENNVNIDELNAKLCLLADEETFFWLDVNEKFNDAEGNLLPEYTSDNVHLLAKHYKEWSEWFLEKTIQKYE